VYKNRTLHDSGTGRPFFEVKYIIEEGNQPDAIRFEEEKI
jgi:hypothetical protein